MLATLFDNPDAAKEFGMGKLQQILNDQIARLPKLMLRTMIEQKLQEQAVALPADALEALLDHILAGSGERFIWDDGQHRDRCIQLTFDENDASKAKEMCDRMLSAIPEIIERVAEKSGVRLFEALKETWTLEGAIQRYELDQFRDRLEERWEEGLQLLRMLLTSVREIGHETARRFRRSRSKKNAHRRFVLLHLHSRACQVTDEILTLMENGFADGAMARWRTLHELSIVATLIHDGDEDLAKRYIDHDIVDVKKHADEYDQNLVPLGYPSLPLQERKRIDRNYTKAIQQYGKPFGTDYGWTASLLENARPTFQQLQHKANQSNMNGYYKLANVNVHASARAMFFRMTDIEENIPISGPSNSGLAEPGQNAAFSLLQITSTLLTRPWNLDRIIEMNALIAIRDAIPVALDRADTRLRRDERKEQRGKKLQAGRSRTKKAN